MFDHELVPRRGQSMVGLLVVLVIIGILVGIYFWRQDRSGSDGGSLLPMTGTSTPKAAMDQARGVECQLRLQQIRQALQMAETTEGEKPDSLTQLGSHGVSAPLLQCPLSKQAYQYDPDAAQVWCPDHTRY